MPWDDKQSDHPGPWGSRPPGGGRGGKPPPGPNLDDLLRQFHNKFRQTLRGGGGHDSAKGAVLAAIIAVLLWLSSGIYFVHPDQQGVVMRFGQYVRTTAPGLNYHLPYPIETVVTPRVTAINHVEIGYRSAGLRGENGSNDIPEESLMLTGDENIVDINFEVQWKISNAPDFLFNVRNQEETVRDVSESAMREVIGKAQIAGVLAEGKLQVEIDTKKLIQETLDSYKAGIEVVAVNLLKADPPAEVIDAFRDVQTARTDLETARNQAEAYSNDILPKAQGQAQKIILDAEAYKQQAIAQAQGEASQFLAVYNQYKEAKEVTRKRMYLETMEDLLQGMNKIIIDKSGSGVVPYLPLPEIKPAGGESTQ